jgi:hypothetical protein
VKVVGQTTRITSFVLGLELAEHPRERVLLRVVAVHDAPGTVVDDGLGAQPFDPAEIVADIDPRRLPSEDIGLLTQPVDPVTWLARLRSR